jgi:hypothetical protein
LATAEKERQLKSFEHEAKQQEAKLGAQRDSKRHTQVLQLAKELRDGRITHIFCFSDNMDTESSSLLTRTQGNTG